ncbi:kinase-like domain-containing protein [Elsinoe ampelina]|uniref:non-specific serine/threonine protein kinase n=1 Tax=Elsinoe ampelina TaxID=302913 RepID=A0A6A6GJ99_9PEZI|nr:kinase-like domain-containing protein [Elsinoe ampelina]
MAVSSRLRVSATLDCPSRRLLSCHARPRLYHRSSSTSHSTRHREEDRFPNFATGDYYPVHPGTLYDNRYKVVAKLGFGTTSTVWLAQDLKRRLDPLHWLRPKYTVLKFLTASASSNATVVGEVASSNQLSTGNPSHLGKQYLRLPLRTFDLWWSGRKYPCLVQEPMRESLGSFRRHFPDRCVPRQLIRPVLEILLQGLDYMHRCCGLIHTDLHPANILVGIEDPAIIEELLQRVSSIYAGKSSDEHPVYPSYTFGALRGPPSHPKIADFGLAVDARKKHTHAIQPDRLRAPEVTLGTEWDAKVDVWSLGVMMWDLLEGHPLFEAREDETGEYSALLHLREMHALLGPPPRSLLRRSPYAEVLYDDKGLLRDAPLPVEEKDLANTVTKLDGEDKVEFLRIMRKMLQWDPDDRPSAAELLEDPWMKSLRAS